MGEWSSFSHSRFIHSRLARSSKAIVIKASDIAVTCACRDLQIGILLKLSVVHCILYEWNLIHEIHVRDIICSYVYGSQKFIPFLTSSQVFVKYTRSLFGRNIYIVKFIFNDETLKMHFFLNTCIHIFTIYVVNIYSKI